MQNIFTEEKIVSFIEAVEKSNTIAIVTHINPDGDAIGSAGALKEILKNIYPKKQVRAFVPNAYPEFLSWTAKRTKIEICKSGYISKIRYIQNADFVLVADLNSIDRTEHLAMAINKNTGTKMLIDHHINPDTSIFNTVFHTTDASSTCYIAYGLIKAAGWEDKVDSAIASALLCGIITDTGGFSYSGLTGDLFRTVGELIDKGADPVAIHQAVFDHQSESRLRLLGYLLNDKMITIPEKKAAYITLTEKEKKRFHYKIGDTEGIVNYPMTISGISTSAIFVENTDYIKVSLRSQGNEINVNEMCHKWFNGGGHFNAAGGKFFGTMEEAENTYRKALEEL